MMIEWMNLFVSFLQLTIAVGMFVLAVLLFWHLKRIQKPTLAKIFWCVLMLSALTPAFQFIQTGMPLSAVPIYFALIFVLGPLMILAIVFFNPLKPIVCEAEEDIDDDEPFEIPDQV